MNKELESLQKCLNKLLRALNGTKVSDQISTRSLLVKFKLLSVNQMNAQVKLTEIWKSLHMENYPIRSVQLERNTDGTNTRARSSGQLKESKITHKSEKTFINDAVHIWNLAPTEIKNSTSLYSAKKVIKTFVSTLPI